MVRSDSSSVIITLGILHEQYIFLSTSAESALIENDVGTTSKMVLTSSFICKSFSTSIVLLWHFFNLNGWKRDFDVIKNGGILKNYMFKTCKTHLLAVTLSSFICYKIFDVVTKLWLAKLNAARTFCFRKRFILRNTTWVIKFICSRSMLARKACVYFVSSLQNYTHTWKFIYIYKFLVTRMWRVVVQNRSVLLPTSLSVTITIGNLPVIGSP